MENWKSHKYKVPIEFYNLSNKGRSQYFDFERRRYDWLKLIELTRYDFQFESISSFFQDFLTFVD
jgi:hypothetical protein